ncbi:MAG: amidohydrolase [Myxococcota bacterium]|nr:amidohydrolase [Myxococcota bacterium]
MSRLLPGTLAILAILSCSGAPERTVYVGGPILTMDAEDRIVSGLGVEGNRIAQVGDEDSVRAWGGENARVVELDGRALLPGFIDAHGHFPGTGIYSVAEDLNSPPIGSVQSIEDIVVRMKQRAAETPEGEWVLGMSYDDTLIAEKRHPTRDDLDRVSSKHPVAVVHTSGHLAVANSLALETIDVDESTPDPPGGHRQRDPQSGRLTGVLEENATLPLTAGALDIGMLQAFEISRTGAEHYAAAGVTTAQSGHTAPELIEGFQWMSRLGVIPIRLVVWPGMETADQILDGDWSFESYDDEWLRLGAVKLIADGSIQGYTGYLSEPYHVPPGDDPEYRGYPRIEPEELAERVQRYRKAGLQVAIHGNGDASIDDILDALENSHEEGADSRPIIIHAQMTRDDQLDRMAELGVIPSFFVLHTFYWGDRHRDIFMGPERAARMSPTRSADERGIPFTIHADTPIVPMEPLRLVWSAVNRRSRSNQVIGADERIDPMRALRAVTIDAARQHFEEDQKGSLEVGKLADLVILSESPIDAPDRIDEIEVLETIVDGETVFTSESAAN